MEVCGLNLSAEIKIKTLIEVLLGMAPKFAWGKKKKKSLSPGPMHTQKYPVTILSLPTKSSLY